MKDDDGRYWPDSGLTVGLAAIVALALSVVLCLLDPSGTSIAASLEPPLTIAAMAIAALRLTDQLRRPRALATARPRAQ
jgi:hypothetical protein